MLKKTLSKNNEFKENLIPCEYDTANKILVFSIHTVNK